MAYQGRYKTPPHAVLTYGELFAAFLVLCLISAVLSLPGSKAREIRLIGECDGKFYGAMEEDQFPAGCAWIEPIRFDVD